MAMFKAHGALEHVSGKCGGVFFRQMPCSNQIVTPPRRIKKQPTQEQLKVQQAFRFVYRFWHRYVEKIYSGQWWNYANRHPRTGRKGQEVYWTATDWFMHFNITLYLNGQSLILLPPED